VRQELTGLLVGACVGGVMAWLFAIPWAIVTFQVVSDPLLDRSFIAPCDERRGPLVARRNKLFSELKALATDLSAAEALSKKLMREQTLWPKEVSETYQRGSVEAMVTGAIARSESRVVATEFQCEEFPCVVTLEGLREKGFTAFLEALKERGFSGVELLVRSVKRPRPHGGFVLVLAYWPDEVGSERLRGRVSTRMDEVMADYMEGDDAR